jgi:hemerythrin
MEFSNIIRRKGTSQEKERTLLDELITQLETEASVKPEESKPIEITDQVKEKMIHLMDSYLSNKEKLNKVIQIRKELLLQSRTHMKDLETLMKLYGLTELIKGHNKFVLDRVVKKKPLKKSEFKEVVTYILGDQSKVDKIYETANQLSEDVTYEKVKCLKYKEK